MILAATVLTAGYASAQSPITPDGGNTTTFTATVSEQADISVPANVAFAVTNKSAAAVSTAQTVTLSNIVLSSASKTLRMSVSSPASFTAPAGATYAAGDVSWNASTFTSGTGIAGTLAATDVVLATCVAAVTTCGTTNLVFTLAPNATVVHSGNHTLVMTWKFESMGS
jgi:hypothetical protein